MSDDLVKRSIAELHDLVQCRCDEAFKSRGLHDPDCHCDTAEAVKIVADRIEELDAKLAKAVEVAERSIKWLRLFGADVHREAAALAEITGGSAMFKEE